MGLAIKIFILGNQNNGITDKEQDESILPDEREDQLASPNTQQNLLTSPNEEQNPLTSSDKEQDQLILPNEKQNPWASSDKGQNLLTSPDEEENQLASPDKVQELVNEYNNKGITATISKCMYKCPSENKQLFMYQLFTYYLIIENMLQVQDVQITIRY